MIRRHALAKATLLAIAGSAACIFTPLVAEEAVIPPHSIKNFQTRCLPVHMQGSKGRETFSGGDSLGKGDCETSEIQQKSRLSSPQRGREAGGEGGHYAVIGCLPFRIQQVSLALNVESARRATESLSRIWLMSGHVQRSPSNQSLLENLEPNLLDLSPPLGLPSVPFPKDNPPIRGRIDLGRQLFFDPRLSGDQSTSCASCHNPEHAFADNKVNSRGINSQKGNRNTPTVINAAFQPYQFWDGRATSLEDQALLPLENPAEMGSSIPTVVDRLNRLPQYRNAFRRVFGSLATRENLARALASFERTILAGDSAYDQYAAGELTALSQKAAEGMKVFQGKAHCGLCHQGHNFSDGLFHNLGVGWDGSSFADQGRSAVTGIFKDRGAFKTPTLRQVAQTAPYMHDGSLADLAAVVDFYDRGGKPNPHLDTLIQPLRLTLHEKEALVEFLRSLSGKVSFYR